VYHEVMQSPTRDPLRRHVAGVVAVLLVGILHGFHDLMEGHPAIAAFVPGFGIALQIVTFSVGHRFGQRRGWSRAKSLALAFPACLFFGCLIVVMHAWQEGHRAHDLFVRSPLRGIGLASFWFLAVGLGVFAFWLLVFYFPLQLDEARTRVLVAESEQRRAELARLRANLHPHFLLNTLNAVAGLVVADPSQARQLIVALGELLRDSLADDGTMRSLGDEAQWLRRYATIFEIRHAGAVRFVWDLHADTLAVKLPRLLLQPLLENAIEHGALRRPGGSVTLQSRSTGQAVEITVADEGPGMVPASAASSSGIGLRLVRERLQLVYPDATMTIDSSDKGTRVALKLPRTALR
jgi:hypothetical protein